jgi:hypothetical protein
MALVAGLYLGSVERYIELEKEYIRQEKSNNPPYNVSYISLSKTLEY